MSQEKQGDTKEIMRRLIEQKKQKSSQQRNDKRGTRNEGSPRDAFRKQKKTGPIDK